jgi:hypothetical protein
MKSRWKDMKYNADLDCWVVFWGDNTGFTRCAVAIGLIFTLEMEGSFLAV